MSYYREQLESWIKKIDVECDSVLDVGGGEKPIPKRVRSFKVRRYKILDVDAQYRPDYFADINYINDIEDPFDCLFCLEVFEYIWNPVQAIENISSFLKPGGIAYVSFPTIYPVHNPYGMDYMRYTKFGVEKLLGTAFQTWEITPRVATQGLASLSSFYSMEGMHPLKNTSIVFDIGYLVKAVKAK